MIQRIHLSLPQELVEALDEACEKNHMTRSEAVKRLLLAVVKGQVYFVTEEHHKIT